MKITIIGLDHDEAQKHVGSLYDPMTETINMHITDLEEMFKETKPAPLVIIDTGANREESRAAIERANKTLGLALDNSEMDYLVQEYERLARPPTDVELFMFAQVNSEHCR